MATEVQVVECYALGTVTNVQNVVSVLQGYGGHFEKEYRDKRKQHGERTKKNQDIFDYFLMRMLQTTCHQNGVSD